MVFCCWQQAFFVPYFYVRTYVTYGRRIIKYVLVLNLIFFAEERDPVFVALAFWVGTYCVRSTQRLIFWGV